MNKEQVTLVAVVALLLLFTVLGGGEERQPRSWGRPRPGPEGPQDAAAPKRGTAFLEEGVPTWSVTARNVYRAPRETTSLPPIELAPPPFPRLPHPGLPLLPPVGGEARRALRHELVPDSSIELGASAGAGGAADGGLPGAVAPEEGAADPSELDTIDLPEPETLADQLRMSYLERLRREQERKRRQKELEERRAKLDSVFWPNGTRDYGRIAEASRKDDRFALKKRMDRIAADASLSSAERRQLLEDIRLEFLRDRGPGRSPSKMVITGASVDRIEFANTPYNRFRLRKLDAREDLPVQMELAELVIESGRLDEAAKHLEGMIEQGLDAERVYSRLADCYHRLLDYDAELNVLRRGLETHPRSPALHARMGQLYIRLSVPDLAEEQLREALRLDGGNALANLGLGKVLLADGRPAEALPYFNQAVHGVGLDDGQQREAMVLRGCAHLRLGNVESALREFEGIIERLDPGHAPALQGLASAHLARGNVEEALSVLDRAVEAQPLDGGLRYLRGVAFFRKGGVGDAGAWSEGRDSLLLAMDLDPLLTDEVRTAMSYLMEKVGQDEAALAEAEQALEADPGNVAARMQRARVLYNVGDLEGAEEAFRKVLDAEPDRTDVLVILGDVAFRKGDVNEALRYYDRAELVDPSFPYLKMRRLVCYVRQKRLVEAQEILAGFSSSDRRDPPVRSAVAFWHYSRGNPQETLQLLERLRREEGVHPDLVAYAAGSAERIEENLSKELWQDSFNRSGPELLRSWEIDRGYGVQAVLEDNRVVLAGTQKKLSDRPTIVYQKRPCRRLASFGADLVLRPQPGAFSGIGIMTFGRTGRSSSDAWPGYVERGSATPRAGIQVALGPEAALVYRVLDRGTMSDWQPVPNVGYRGGRVIIEFRVVDRKGERFDVLVDNQPVLRNLHIPSLATSNRMAELQVFTQAVIGRPVKLEVDNVRIITYKI